MTDERPIAMSHGLPSTVLPPADADAQRALADALAADPAARRDALAAVAAGIPATSTRGQSWVTPAATTSSAMRTTGSATTADSTRCGPTAGGDPAYVRWSEPTNRGFLRSLAGLGAMAEAIGEADEAERIATFLVQLDPDGGRRSAMTAGAVLCGGQSRRMGTDKAVVEVDGVAMAERVAEAVGVGGVPPGGARRR